VKMQTLSIIIHMLPELAQMALLLVVIYVAARVWLS